MTGQEPRLWLQVERHINTKQQKEYDQAIDVLRDLRDLARRAGTEAMFDGQVSDLRERHHGKPSLVKRLDNAKLR